MPRTLIILLLIFICPAAIRGQQEPGRTQKRKFLGIRGIHDTLSTEKDGFFVLPLVYYTPDTRWAFGAAGVYYFKITARSEKEKDTRMSNVQFLADYTQNRQLDLWAIWQIFSRNENYLFKGEARYRNFPDRFYGIGNNTSVNDGELYEYNLVSLKNLVLRQVWPALFVGLDYHFEKEYGFRYTRDGVLESGAVRGYRGSTGSALGSVAVYDDRDNVINTRRGRLAEISSYFYSPILGSTFPFTYVNFLYQHFWPLDRRHVIASQTKIRIGSGQIPFLDMSTVGNDDMLRGYPKNRFRDNNFAGTQVEYRFPLFWRLGGVAFAGVGDVFHRVADLETRLLKYSVGGGLRFLINPAERLNVRLDYGYGREGGHFYFMVAESF